MEISKRTRREGAPEISKLNFQVAKKKRRRKKRKGEDDLTTDNRHPRATRFDRPRRNSRPELADVGYMKKKLFVYLTVFSLLMCAATIWMWVGSSSNVTQVALRTRGQSSFQLWGHGGKIAFSREAVGNSPRGEFSWAVIPNQAKDGEALKSLTAFSYSNGALTLPMWAVVLSSALLPGWWAKSKVMPKKKKSGGGGH